MMACVHLARGFWGCRNPKRPDLVKPAAAAHTQKAQDIDDSVVSNGDIQV